MSGDERVRLQSSAQRPVPRCQSHGTGKNALPSCSGLFDFRLEEIAHFVDDRGAVRLHSIRGEAFGRKELGMPNRLASERTRRSFLAV